MADPPVVNETNLENSDASTKEINRRLDSIAKQKPELAGAFAFYRTLLPILENIHEDIPTFRLDSDTAQRKLAQGVSLLVGEDLPFDDQKARMLFEQLCRLVETTPDRGLRPHVWLARLQGSSQLGVNETEDRAAASESRPAAAARIRQAVEQGDLDLPAVWQASRAGRWEKVKDHAIALHLEPGTLRMLAEFSLIPFLRVWARRAAEQVDLDLWLRQVCPLCGSRPILAEIQGKESAQRLRCGICGAGWYYPRLKCARCGNEDYRSLGTLSVEGEEEKYRLHTCQACHGYIKVVVTFEPTPVHLLVVEDLTTLHLDIIALEHGFGSGRVS